MRLLITGGAGFIGSALVRRVIADTDHEVVTVDKLTYAGNMDSLVDTVDHPRHAFERVDISDAVEIRRVFDKHRPDAVIHLAAESHVDRSIDGPAEFIGTNVVGTFTLLQATRRHLDTLDGAKRRAFRFIHVSTDEVFGSLGANGAFTEETPYRPRSPYSASKAAADHLVRAWHHTYGLPCMVTNCSNNYGAYQFPEKMIPLMILNALERKPLPVYGDGENVRDWIHVDDHSAALLTVLDRGRAGETYVIGGNSERRNLDVVHAICDLVDELRPDPEIPSRRALVRFVADRPGHDLRYAVDATRITAEIGWRPVETFDSGLRRTVAWYLDNPDWWTRVRSGVYRGERLGLGVA